MALKIEKIVGNCVLAEGPHWDEETQSLFFVDIPGQAIYKYVPATKKSVKAPTAKSVSLIIPVRGEKGKFLISLDRELVIINWDGESETFSIIEKLAEVDNSSETITNRLNDGKCDPSGRLWAGTMGRFINGQCEAEKAALYSFQNNKLEKILTKVSLSNGLAFNEVLKKFYYIDSPKNTVDEFDFDVEKGTIANRKVIFSLSNHNIPGGPDGMTIDTDGNLWVAIMKGGRVIKIDPRKPESLLDTISLPLKHITSVAFGGENLDELYVTSASSGEDKTSPNGAVFRITGVNAKGFPGISVIL